MTDTQLKALQDAMASGVTLVKFGEREIRYRDLAEMQQIERKLLAKQSNKPQITFASHRKGLR